MTLNILIFPVPYDVNSQLRQKKIKTSPRRNELKMHDLILSFHVLLRTTIGSKTFLRSLWKVSILCDFLNLGCLRIITKSRQP